MAGNIVFATCMAMPALQKSDAAAASALAARGWTVNPAAWNGDPAAFDRADAIVVRSAWDYQEAPARFAEWLASLENKRRVFNSPALMRANMSKRYLLDLKARGAPLPDMTLAAPDADAIAAAMDALGLEEAVVKPEFGATGSGLSKVRRDDPAGLEAAAAKMAMPGLVQPLIPEIMTAGETSFVFLGGEFTHAVTKRPRPGEIRCQAEHGGTTTAATPPGWAVEEARQICAMLGEIPLYARIDAVLLDERMQLMEVELIEPELFFTYAPATPDNPGPAARFADALLERL